VVGIIVEAFVGCKRRRAEAGRTKNIGHFPFGIFHFPFNDYFGAIFVNCAEFGGHLPGHYPRAVQLAINETQMENEKCQMENDQYLWLLSPAPTLHQLRARPYNPNSNAERS
jgi:hypothetical protein